MAGEIDFNVIAQAFKKRFPDQEVPGIRGAGEQPLSNQLAQQSAMGGGTLPQGTLQEPSSVSGVEKSEAQKIIEVLGSRLKRLPA